jgi:hypothetical protein
MNQTPLMAAAAAGNVALVEALLALGANRETVDHYGYNALHWAMHEAFQNEKFARGPFAALYEQLAPASIDVNTGERLVRIDRHLSEYLLFQSLWVLFKSRFTHIQRRNNAAFETQSILDAWQHLPANVVRPERNKRAHLSNVLSRNEVERDYAYNRALFVRIAQGWYQFNPKLCVRSGQGDAASWTPVYAALNLPLINEFSIVDEWRGVSGAVDRCLAMAGLPARTTPIVAERAVARDAALQLQRTSARSEPAPWSTKLAKQQEIERIRQAIEARKKKT